jgi:hypothetical protein
MKLKLDLHPIFADSQKIEQSLVDIIDEAVEKRASEVEIIPGKGSGALKKTVLRFLDRPEIKSRYHRVEKDDENFGRIFVHFRFTSDRNSSPRAVVKPSVEAACFCCQSDVLAVVDDLPEVGEKLVITVECQSCSSPNKINIFMGRGGKLMVKAESGYEESE